MGSLAVRRFSLGSLDWRRQVAWAVTYAVVAGTVLLSLGRVHPLIELVSNLRLHALIGCMGALVGVAILRQRRAAAVVALMIAVNGWFLAPYFVGVNTDPLPPDPDQLIRVLQYNILYLNQDVQGIASEILDSDADVIALHELTHGQWAAVSPLIEAEYPYSIAEPAFLGETGSTGRALLSREPLTPVTLTGAAAPIAATTTVRGAEVLAIGLHPSPSRSDRYKIDRRRQKLQSTASLVAAHEGPAIVIADLNIAPTSHEYSDFVDSLGWHDPRATVGWEATWSRPPDPLGLPIDHIFVSDEFLLHDYVLGDGGGSDHRSLLAVLSLGEER